ncbi:N-acetylmuramoyl-L-alanine amidase, partial [Xanthomonas perforans]
ATTLDAEDLRILSALTHHARPSSPRPALEPTEGDDH